MTRYERKLFFETLLALREAYRTETHEATDTTIETVTAFAEQAYNDSATVEVTTTTIAAGKDATTAD